jgi:zona occludens toxin (predicted ATPase)
MSLRIIEGSKGSGKSAVATAFAETAFKQGREIYSNIELGFDFEYIDKEMFTTKEGRAELQDCFIFLDEAHNLFPAYRCMSDDAIAMSFFVKQIRKRQIDVCMTTQQATAVYIDLRRNLDVLDECTAKKIVMQENGRKGMRDATLYEIEHKLVDAIMIKETLLWTETSTKPAVVKWRVLPPKELKRIFTLYNSDEFVEF